jgi:hypothetical protein
LGRRGGEKNGLDSFFRKEKLKYANAHQMHMGYTPPQNTVSARVNLSPYANKVLGIVKIKFELNDKSEALNKFVEIYGDEIVEKEASDDYVKKVMRIADEHFEKYGEKKMSIEELNELCGVTDV